MSTPNTTADFLTRVFEASRKSGSATQDLVRIIRTRKIDWTNDSQVLPIRREFYLGRIAASLNLDHVEADDVLAKTKPSNEPTKGDNSKRRTFDEHRAYRAAVSAWSHVAMLAGQPNKVTGKKRGTKKRAVGSASTENTSTGNTSTGNTSTDLITGAITVTPATSPQDVRAFALRVSAIVHGYCNQNAKKLEGELGDFLRHLPETIRKLVPDAIPPAIDKPRTTPGKPRTTPGKPRTTRSKPRTTRGG